ncbi:type I restriction-modification system subunit M/S [Nocardia amikacinitolerans]|uniref:type I restriction-modification system subunit M/S n=1 Tax=Nocardia amikacinitolerans TaxID=756689 RepID=UPI0020A5179F|nr:type I restriction-modification system subunit M/S [Nocardia amikacinitolerans]MCP2290296.1 type I restriction enzyme M protein [Nocardia amikacinitolerans]
MPDDMNDRESAATLPVMPLSRAVASALWKAMDRLRSAGTEIGALRNLALGIIYLQATDNSWSEITPSTTSEAGRVLRDVALELKLLQIKVAEVEHIDPETSFELLRAVGGLIQDRGTRDAFRVILEMTMGARGNYLTPASVVSAMVNSVGVPAGGTIYDPASRAGELLTAAASVLPHSLELNPPEFRARSLTTEFAAITRMNLELHSLGRSVDLAASDDVLSESTPKFTRIITNPPFNYRWTPRRGLPWRYGEPPASNANYVWLQRIVERLAPDGRAAVLMPHAASTSDRDRNIRAGMVDDGCVEALITLPTKLFRGTGIGVTIWLLRPPGTPVDSILFVDASSAGHMVSQTERVLSNEELQEISSILAEWRSGGSLDAYETATAVRLQRVRETGYNLSPAIYLAPTPTVIEKAAAEQSIQRALTQLRADQRKATESFTAAVAAACGGWGTSDISPPSEWTETQLGEICQITPGASTKDSREGDVCVAKPRNVVSGRLSGPTDYIDAEQARHRSAYRIEPGDVLCTRTGTVGKVALASPVQSGWIFGTGLIRIRPLPDADPEVDPEFLSLYLTHPDTRDWFLRNATGSAIQSISAATLRTLPLRLPPLPDQQSIARALRTLDEMIVAHEDVRRTTRKLRDTLLPFLLSGGVGTGDWSSAASG